MEPFYFKSYDKVVGAAYNANELEMEIERLSKIDQGCVEWHLKQGHIVNWLNYIGEKRLAKMLSDVTDVKEALDILSKENEINKDNTMEKGNEMMHRGPGWKRMNSEF